MMRIQTGLILVLALLAVACKPEAQAVPAAAEPEIEAETDEVAEAGATASEKESDDRGGKEDGYDRGKAMREGMPKGITDEYYSCLKEGNYAALDSMNCMSDEEKRQDKKLNEIYQELLGMLDGGKKERLVAAQKAWLQSRSKDESLEAVLYGGDQVENAQVSLNELVRLAQRVDLLDKYLGPAEISGH